MLHNNERSQPSSAATISYGSTVRNNIVTTICFTEVLDTIRTGNGITDEITTIRACPDKNQRHTLKQQHLPWFSFAEFKDNERSNANFVAAKHLVIDIDNIPDQLAVLKQQICQDETIYMAFISPSGDGLKFAIRLDSALTTIDSYRQAYQYYAELYATKYDFVPDGAVHDPARACFFSYDPDLYLNENSTPASTSEIVATSVSVSSTKKKKSLKQKLEPQQTGNRTPMLASQIGTYINRGISKEEALQLAILWNKGNPDPLTDEKIESTVSDMYDLYEKGKYDHYWSYQTDILEFGLRGEEFFMNKIGPRKLCTFLNAYTKEERDRVFDHVVKLKHIPHIKRVNHIGDVAVDESYYDVKSNDGEIDVHYAAIPERIEDNQYIDDYLDQVFGPHKQFIKEWLAVYTYTNYQKLPTLVLIGKRGTGKNTFAEFIGEIYKPLSQMWHGDERNFSPEVEKKLLIADETVSEDPEQYKTLKKYSGEKYAMVNKKYQPPYEVVNNMNIVILSNGKTPIFVEREEAPTSQSNNQFFVYEFPLLTAAPDARLSTKLTDRLGHYIRTELKNVYNGLNMTGNRYSIKVPITDAERSLFTNNASDVELEADRIVEKLVDKYQNANSSITDFVPFLDDGYLPTDFIEWFYDAPNRRTCNKAIKNLKERGFLVGDKQRHAAGNVRKYAYKMSAALKAQLPTP